MKRIVKIAVTLLIVIAVIIGVLFVCVNIIRDINGTEKKDVKKYTLTIEENDFEYQISEKLKNNDIVIDDSIWTMWMNKHYPDFVYLNGEYYLDSSMSYEEIAEKLKEPDISHRVVKVAIPEGYNVFEIAETLEKNGICSADDFYEAASTAEGYDYEWLADFPKDNKNVGFILEGFLFPATYDLQENTPAKEVVDEMLNAFDVRLSRKMTSFCEENDMTLYEFITLCSIVQEEALTRDSADRIASVLINRLERGSKLQCDVTYYYAKKLLDYGFSKDCYDSYYTYRCPALPSGPITNPGMDIINAVIEHSDTDYLFFFSDKNGEFHFAATSDEFEALKKQYPWK